MKTLISKIFDTEETSILKYRRAVTAWQNFKFDIRYWSNLPYRTISKSNFDIEVRWLLCSWVGIYAYRLGRHWQWIRCRTWSLLNLFLVPEMTVVWQAQASTWSPSHWLWSAGPMIKPANVQHWAPSQVGTLASPILKSGFDIEVIDIEKTSILKSCTSISELQTSISKFPKKAMISKFFDITVCNFDIEVQFRSTSI